MRTQKRPPIPATVSQHRAPLEGSIMRDTSTARESIHEVAAPRQPELPTGPVGVLRFTPPAHNPTAAHRVRPFGRLPDHVILAANWPGLTARDKTIWSAYAKHENHETGQCNPRKSTVATETGYSVASVKRSISSLSEKGLLKVHRGTRPNGSPAPNCYEVILPGSAQVPANGLTSGIDAGSPGVDEPGGRVRVNPGGGVRVTLGGGVRVTPPLEELNTEVLTMEEREAPAPVAPAPPRGTTTAPARSLSPTHTCPQCKRSWPESYGDVCHDCNATITEIRRRLEAGGKYANIPVTSIGGTGLRFVPKQTCEIRKFAAIAWREKERERCVERERIAEAKRVDDEQREKERREQEENPEWQAEQKRKADEAHKLRLEALRAKQNERTV